uniref:Uncharacterized protein n=1 Tax=candidate division CPR3 bacterium TaxID=2268181 RepID=A0A7C4R5J9_UNCC3
MADIIKEKTTTGYGKRIGNAFSGIVIGLILFFASFGVLFWNEGKIDISNIAKTATVIDPTTQLDDSLNGKLISAYGEFKTEENIDDGLYLNPSNYLALERKVEMYSWKEEAESTTKENLGGSETTETTYTYKKDWVENPQDSSDFKEPTGHTNPTQTIKSEFYKAKNAKIGQYSVDLQSVKLPEFDDLALSNEIIKTDPDIILKNGFIYKPINKINPAFGQIYNVDDPQVGDLRISYRYLPSGITGTIFGAPQGNRISSYTDTKGNTLFRIFRTTHELAVNQMHTEFVTSRWIWRIAGFLMMWFGLSSIMGIIGTILAVVPFLASIGRGLISVITFIVALIFTILTILVSQILHSWIALLVLAILAIASIIFLPKLLKNRKIAKK